MDTVVGLLWWIRYLVEDHLAIRSCLPMDLAGMTEVHIDTA